MERRGFLKVLGMSIPATVALTALPFDGFDALVYNTGLPRINEGPINVVSFQTMTRRVQQAMAKAMTYQTETVTDRSDLRLGNEVLYYDKPVTLAHQLSATNPNAVGGHAVVSHLTHGQELPAADLDVIGQVLAAEASHREVNLFVPMVVKIPGVEACNVWSPGQPSVRGIAMYDIATDGLMYRFDVLGGHA